MNKTSKHKLVKQLNAALKRKNKQPKRLQRANKKQNPPNVGLPTRFSTSVIQRSSPDRVHTDSALVPVGKIVLSPATTAGEKWVFQLNPLKLLASRLSRLASNYQKYRFTRARLVMQTSANTGVNGIITYGYCSNPDAEIPPGVDAGHEYLMALPGSKSSTIWSPDTFSDARLLDRSKWYNIDLDSREIMETTQGYFAVLVYSVPNIASGVVELPVYLDYDIQMVGTANNVVSASSLMAFPAGTFSYNSVTGNFTFTADAGEPAVPSTTNFDLYAIQPQLIVDIVSPSGDEMIPSTVAAFAPTTASWVFFLSVEDASMGTILQLSHSFHVPRFTIQKVGTVLN